MLNVVENLYVLGDLFELGVLVTKKRHECLTVYNCIMMDNRQVVMGTKWLVMHLFSNFMMLLSGGFMMGLLVVMVLLVVVTARVVVSVVRSMIVVSK